MNLEIVNITATITQNTQTGSAGYIAVPFDVKQTFGSAKPKIVAIFDNKFTYRGSLVKYGTPFHMLLIRKEFLQQLNKKNGDEITVQLSLDKEERTVVIPDDLESALKQHQLYELFCTMSYTYRKEYVQAVVEAKKPETRASRIQKCISVLKKK